MVQPVLALGDVSVACVRPQLASDDAQEQSSLVEVAVVEVVLGLQARLGSKYRRNFTVKQSG